MRRGNPDQSVTTDEGGVAVVRLRAGRATRPCDDRGQRSRRQPRVQPSTWTSPWRRRPDSAAHGAGRLSRRRPHSLQVYSTSKRGTAYVDVVKEGQTILTRDLDIVNGQAELSLDGHAGAGRYGRLQRVLFGRDAQPVGDHRLVFVQPADELKIETTADAPVYKPGDEPASVSA